jgi:hypothetical protein
MFMLSQIVGRAWGFGEIAIAVIVALAVIGIVIVATRVMGVPIPQWVWQIIGIVVVACVAIVAIRFLLGM